MQGRVLNTRGLSPHLSGARRFSTCPPRPAYRTLPTAHRRALSRRPKSPTACNRRGTSREPAVVRLSSAGASMPCRATANLAPSSPADFSRKTMTPRVWSGAAEGQGPRGGASMPRAAPRYGAFFFDWERMRRMDNEATPTSYGRAKAGWQRVTIGRIRPSGVCGGGGERDAVSRPHEAGGDVKSTKQMALGDKNGDDGIAAGPTRPG